MRYTNVRTFHKEFFDQVEDLPVTVTKYGKPYLVVSLAGAKNPHVETNDQTNDHTGENPVTKPNRNVETNDYTNVDHKEKVDHKPSVAERAKMRAEEKKKDVEFHECEWNKIHKKALKCKSPAVVQVEGKWLCVAHITEYLEE